MLELSRRTVRVTWRDRILGIKKADLCRARCSGLLFGACGDFLWWERAVLRTCPTVSRVSVCQSTWLNEHSKPYDLIIEQIRQLKVNSYELFYTLFYLNGTSVPFTVWNCIIGGKLGRRHTGLGGQGTSLLWRWLLALGSRLEVTDEVLQCKQAVSLGGSMSCIAYITSSLYEILWKTGRISEFGLFYWTAEAIRVAA